MLNSTVSETICNRYVATALGERSRCGARRHMERARYPEVGRFRRLPPPMWRVVWTASSEAGGLVSVVFGIAVFLAFRYVSICQFTDKSL